MLTLQQWDFLRIGKTSLYGNDTIHEGVSKTGTPSQSLIGILLQNAARVSRCYGHAFSIPQSDGAEMQTLSAMGPLKLK
jgi:hypothetical protein